MKENRFKVLNREDLKLLAILAMTMDHVAGGFLPNGSAVWLAFRIVGRITFPIMACLLADGFLYTHDLKKYISRLFWFSVLSWFTFSFLETGSFLPVRLAAGDETGYPFNRLFLPTLNRTLCICRFSVLTGLLCSLLFLTVWEKSGWKLPGKLLASCALVLITMNCDWYWLNIPMVMCFYYLRNDPSAKWAVFTGLSLLYIFDIFGSSDLFAPYVMGGFKPYRVGMLLPPVLIGYFYNGKKGRGGAFGKWFFYGYYPAHQLILGILQVLFA